MYLVTFDGVSVFLPGRSGYKIPIQQPQLAEQNSVDEGNRGQLLQGQVGLKLKFLLFHKEGHCLSLSARIKHNYRRREDTVFNLERSEVACAAPSSSPADVSLSVFMGTRLPRR